MKLKSILVATAATVIITACGGGGGEDNLVTAQKFVDELNESDTYRRGNYRVLKTDANQVGYMVFWNAGRDVYEVIDIDALRDLGYYPDEAAREYMDGGFRGYGEEVRYVGGGEYEGRASGLLYEETAGSELDVLYAAKVAENLQVESSARVIAEKYGLSEEQGLRVSNLALNWDKLSESRELTSSDLNSFSQELFGISVQEIKNAAQASIQGDNSAKEALITEASQALETTPENAQSILADFVN